MPIDMTALNVKNFSYFAFHPKELKQREKKILILAHVLLGLSLGLGHAITGIVYAVNKKKFDAEILNAPDVRTLNFVKMMNKAHAELENDYEEMESLSKEWEHFIINQ